MKMSHFQLMRKASYNSLGMAILYAVMGLVSFNANAFAGVIGLFVSVICFREFQQMGEASLELKAASEKESN